ncbi:MAG: hypothetical protein COA88_00600 [Kordia sp.]|nr:MAG: hypothetical protein COA88_00600 [Kordia sp.]
MEIRKTYNKTHYFLITVILLCYMFTHAQYDNINFTNLSSKDGLSQNTIFKIFQDSRGFFWFGTEDGLNKYDGYKFKLFSDSFKDETNIINKEVKFIDEDSKGVFWFGSKKGLNRFDRKTNEISAYLLNSNTNILKGDYIDVFLIDNEDRIWIGTNSGVFLMKNDELKEITINTKSITKIRQIIQDKNGLVWLINNKKIYQYKEEVILKIFKIKKEISFSQNAIVAGANNDLWMGTNLGVYVFNTKEKSLTNIVSKENKKINNVFISAISIDNDGFIWTGTRGEGLFKIEYKTKDDYLVKHYSKRSIKSPRLSSNNIHDIFIDKSNVLWVGTVLGGVNKGALDLNFNHFKTDFKELNFVEPDPIFSLCEDGYQNLWIGTYGYGLYKLNKKNKTYTYYSGTEGDKSGFIGTQVYNISEDLHGDVWFSVGGGGMLKYNRESDTFDVFEHENLSQQDLVNSVVFKESKGNLWIGTWRKGVYFYNLKDKTIKHFKGTLTKSSEMLTGWVNYLTEDVIEQRLWVAYENGLNVIDLKTDKVYKLDNSVGGNNGLRSNYIYSVHQDTDGSFWLGTESGLVEILEYKLKDSGVLELKTRVYAKKDGFLNDVTYGMLEDENKNLWVSTNKGLAKFNRETKEIKNYLDSDGLQGNEFNMGAFYKSKSGEFMFGGINGVTAFYPEKIQENTVSPKVAITEFRMLNNVVIPSIGGVINKDINEVDTLNLNFKDNVFSFEIAALEFTNSENNQCAYKLEGFDKEWNYIGTRKHITFTNLNPGKYILKLKGTNNDGVWSTKEKQLKIIIPPPFWRTIWFYIFCGFMVLGMGLMIFMFRLNQIKLKTEKRVLYQKNEEKNIMLKEIHHRVKNNLQVVNSLLSLQSREVDDERIVGMFNDARKRVLSMAMLHERMYGSDDLKYIDIHEHLKSLIENLINSYAVDKNIDLEINVKDIKMGISTLTPLGLMIIEMITNSLKYAFETKSKGTIYTSLKHLEGRKYELIVGDDGVGFNEKHESSALGTKLIHIFTKQLNGKIEKLKKEGTFYKLVFEKID